MHRSDIFARDDLGILLRRSDAGFFSQKHCYVNCQKNWNTANKDDRELPVTKSVKCFNRRHITS